MSHSKSLNTKAYGKVGIFVMGDIGRSPRMMNHAIEFAQNEETAVEIIGQVQSELPLFFASENIRVRTITSKYLQTLKRLPSFLYLFFRIFVETMILFYHFMFQIRPKYNIVVVQNPPGIPVIIVLFFYKWIFNAKIWVDVHNFGYTLYQTKNKYLLKILKLVEIYSIRFTADRVFVVSKNMKEHLNSDWRIKNVTVLYDKPNFRTFRKMELKEKHNFLINFPEFTIGVHETLISTHSNKGVYEEKTDRPLLFVVSSSWSHDDYFDLLIEAVKKYSVKEENTRKLFFIMTGSGPLKSQYSRVFLNFELKNIQFAILWFQMADYPKIIGSVDYGISLHNSTSGFDLPIKALDYMACEVPCLAYNYTKTIGELVIEKKNGMLFNSADELMAIFEELGKNQLEWKWQFSKNDWTTEWRNKIY